MHDSRAFNKAQCYGRSFLFVSEREEMGLAIFNHNASARTNGPSLCSVLIDLRCQEKKSAMFHIIDSAVG